jgi:hypothetical protein
MDRPPINDSAAPRQRDLQQATADLLAYLDGPGRRAGQHRAHQIPHGYRGSRFRPYDIVIPLAWIQVLHDPGGSESPVARDPPGSRTISGKCELINALRVHRIGDAIASGL